MTVQHGRQPAIAAQPHIVALAERIALFDMK
jgi:hypothetical protein